MTGVLCGCDLCRSTEKSRALAEGVGAVGCQSVVLIGFQGFNFPAVFVESDGGVRVLREAQGEEIFDGERGLGRLWLEPVVERELVVVAGEFFEGEPAVG